ncbi:hypothetical protein EHS13_35315 [Paenibacillus psychroresistens]|uniref:Uncharacterized protein n=1 Tax=Paenibacillus psychroresistens TaxID=1778678 RepID=A0A6B8RTP1_9BACL|nr:hypothetical protein [Paenibacillus psychroresistens]QGQ99761.1 hypothetical protein EHS13_35315 [Paenibacillus psychroresistens]
MLVRPIKQFENGAYITMESADVQWFTPDGFKPYSDLFEVIGNRESHKFIDLTKTRTYSGGWNLIISQTSEQFEQERTEDISETKIRLMDYIKS